VLRFILLSLLFLFIARAVWRLLGGVLQASATMGDASRGQRPAAGPPAVKMVRDPVCGTYVVPGKALELTRGGQTVYFCSDKCRDQWGPGAY